MFFQTQNTCIFVILGAKILYKKCKFKTLMKLTPELHFKWNWSLGYYYTKEAIKKNSFSAEEVFETEFLSTLKNSTLYWMKEYNSLYFGTCFTICYLEKVHARKSAAIPLKRNLTLVLYFHTKGEEVWYTTKTHLDAKSFSLNSNEVGIIDTRWQFWAAFLYNSILLSFFFLQFGFVICW